ncbi:MAG: SusC/RagA family TonB-linked outer membrane protein [Bacilli bacterium]|nr:SusC/RagA family TonB-linked outer membrane protein [Bacilli bacterium]
MKRVNVSGAIGTADSKTFESRPVQNASSALQGEMPGLTITRKGGTPGGSDIDIKIRDISSINGGAPLILIDGAEGTLSLLNPADIESVSVLKDGNAAIYGARAADGVILVTTKSGKKNQPLKVSVDAYYALRKPALLKKTVNLYQYAAMGLEITDGSWAPEYTKDDLAKIKANSDEVVPNGIWGAYPKFFKSVNMRDELLGNGNMQSYNVNLTGGGSNYNYLISLGYQDENGLPKYGKDNNKNYFVRAKSNIEVSKTVDFDLNLSYESLNRNYSTQIDGRPGLLDNLWGAMFKTRCWAPIKNPAGGFYTFQYYSNLAQALEEMGEKKTTTGNATFNGKVNWQIINDLKLTGQAIVRKSDGDAQASYLEVNWYDWDNNYFGKYDTPNWADRSYNKTLYKNFTAYLDYNKRLLEKHDLGIMAGVAHESSNYDSFYAARQDFNQQEVLSLQLGSPENQTATSEGNAWTLNSFFARLNYSFMDRYILEGNFRVDGSSRFTKNSRWGYFPGVSLAWRINEEEFIKNLNVFDNLKLRASYGEMGNQSGIGLYDYIQLISISGTYYPFGNGVKGQIAYPSNMVSLERTWETIKSKNIGLDFSVLNNRFSVSFDYFQKNNDNMLISRTFPEVLGALASKTNDGKLQVRGWEIALGWRDRINEFSYSVRASLSDSRNEVIRGNEGSSKGIGLNSALEGYPINSYFGYQFDGIIQTAQELQAYKDKFPNGGVPGSIAIGDAKFKDLDGDGKLETNGDAIYLGDMNPRFNFGLNLNAEYKRFDLGLFIQGVGKRVIFLEGEASMPFEQWWWEPLEYWYGKTWTADRTDAKYPAITLDNKRYYNYQQSTNTKFNTAYARLKNIQVGYTLPNHLTKKAGINKLRFYFSGEDIFEVHNVPGGYDPENTGRYNNYPFTRNFSFGANIVF